MNDFSNFILPLNSAQSPLTRCGTLTRHETLPIFYSTCTFGMRVLGIKRYAYWEDWSGNILSALPRLNYYGMQHIHHLRLDFEARHSISVDDTSDIELAASVTIGISPDGKIFEVRVHLDEYAEQFSEWKAPFIQLYFHTLMFDISMRPKETKWLKQDFEDILDLTQRTCMRFTYWELV